MRIVGLGIIAVIAVLVAGFSFGASTYCLFALTGLGGLQPLLGASHCDRYFAALSALLTPLIATAAAIIAYQQHRTSRATLIDKLYDRRVLVLRGVLAFLSAVARDGRVKAEEIPALVQAMAERRYLFDEGLSSYLDEIRRMAVSAYTKELLFTPEPAGSLLRETLVNQHAELVLQLLEEPARVRERFEPYLKIPV